MVDDGRGFDPAIRPGGFGLSGMRERIALVGGSLAVETSPDGTAVRATLPVTGPRSEEPGLLPAAS